MPSFLFVCTGNICRSPLSEAAMRREAEKRHSAARIRSAGTGHWHIGEPPDRRAQNVARRAGILIENYRAKRLSSDDFHEHSHIIALDTGHLQTLKRLAPEGTRHKVHLLLDFVPGWEGRSVEDPYYKDEEAFETVWTQVTKACEALAEAILDTAQSTTKDLRHSTFQTHEI